MSDSLPRSLTVGDFAIDLLTSADGDFLGFGEVCCGGVRLRDGSRPLRIQIDTAEGILYTRLRLLAVDETAAGVELQLAAIGQPWGRGEYHDDYGQAVLWLQDDLRPVEDRMSLILKPVQLDLGGRTWTGFSLQQRFHSDTRAIHRVLTDATWEIGGDVAGNTLYSQGQCNMPVYRGAREALFTTACLRTLDAHGSPQGNSFQLGPRGGLVQGFDFQVAEAGALFQWWPELESISSLLESPVGSSRLHVLDECRFSQSREVTTPAKHLLFSAGALAEHEARDLWLAARDLVYGDLRQRYGVSPTIALPEAEMHYQTRVVEAPAIGKPQLHMTVAGVEVEHGELLHAIGDHLIPKLAAQGFTRFFPDAIHQSDVTEFGMQRKLDKGIHGDLHCASVCASHRFLPADYWGGLAGWRYMHEKARSYGIEVGHWWAPHFSPRAQIFQDHPEWQMIDAMGFPAGGGYGFHTLNVADWNTPIRQWVLDDLRRWHDEAGLDYLFVDSYSNLGLLQMNYRHDMRTNFSALAGMLADIQAIGIKHLSFECIAPFGVSRFGLADLRGDALEQNRAVAGQNDFAWWIDEEDMSIDCVLAVRARGREHSELERLQFRALANRSYRLLQGQIDSKNDVPDWLVRLHRLYALALPDMQTRRLLPDGAGVRWTGGTADILWLFTDQPAATVGTTGPIAIATPDGWQPHHAASLSAQQVYRINP